MKSMIKGLSLFAIFSMMSPTSLYAGVNMGGRHELTFKVAPEGCSLDINSSDLSNWKGYKLQAASIGNDLIERLLTAIDEPIMDKVDMRNLGITQSWLDAQAQPALDNYRSSHQNFETIPSQQELFLRSFKDISLAEVFIDKYYNGEGWTDDYPQVGLRIIMEDGREIRVYSDSQKQYMLPWKITMDGKRFKTYNADISRAIAALLPEGFYPKDRVRIAGADMPQAITGDLLYQIRYQWDMLYAQDKVGDQIAPIKEQFIIHNMGIAGIMSVNVDSYGLHALLQRKDLPDNILVGLHLPIEEGFSLDIEPFIARSDYYIELAHSVPWLSEYLNARPEVLLEITFVKDASVSRKIKDSILEDMRGHSKTALAEEIIGQLPGSCFVEVVQDKEFRRYSRWIILPDKRMLLLHFTGDEVLSQKASNFKTWQKDYDKTTFYTYTIVLPDGDIETDS